MTNDGEDQEYRIMVQLPLSEEQKKRLEEALKTAMLEELAELKLRTSYTPVSLHDIGLEGPGLMGMVIRPS